MRRRRRRRKRRRRSRRNRIRKKYNKNKANKDDRLAETVRRRLCGFREITDSTVIQCTFVDIY